ncbi:putative AIM2 family protein C30D10.14 [Cladobotryum mycophilum]|uniref:AIM2 family protein C30D10.14 n=1 Tax=Cladobotryum mycophilum TaxID=491253 RepID=A0ABR0SJ47_9HYPO
MATSPKCCELPPVSHEYTPKGKYETIGGVHTYVVGPENSTKGIIDVFDIFGIRAQTIQGADRLSVHSGAVVLVPDLFNGTGLEDSLVPTDTDEKKAKVHAFFGTTANLQDNLAKVLEVRKAAGERFPAAEGHWGLFGLCWGGKVAVLASGEDNKGEGRRFNVSGQAHPGLLDENDARALTCPHIMLAAPDEPVDLVAKYKEVLAEPGKEGVVETYETMFHGWMGARANLQDEKNVKEFQRGYKRVGEYFAKHL